MSRQPDYTLKWLNKATSHKGSKLGVAWKNIDGSIRLMLNDKVTITQHEDEILMLFPKDKE